MSDTMSDEAVLQSEAQPLIAAFLDLLEPGATAADVATLVRSAKQLGTRAPSDAVLQVGSFFRALLASVTLSRFAS